MSIILDIMSSVVIGGIILVIIVGVIANMSQSSYEKYETGRSESNRIMLARQMEFDFEKIGYHAAKPAILLADSVSIWFNADIFNDGVVRGTRYYLGSPSESMVAKTRNPRDRVLYREEYGKTPTVFNFGVTGMHFAYYDSAGKPTLNLSLIKVVDVDFTIETQEPINSRYEAFTWQKRFFPMNL